MGMATTQQPLAPRTSDTGSSLWPTPVAADANPPGQASRTDGRQMQLANLVRMWPTPTSRDHKDGSYCPNVPVNGLLGRAVWPTPRAVDSKINASPGELRRKWPGLAAQVEMRRWPTPKTPSGGGTDERHSILAIWQDPANWKARVSARVLGATLAV